MTPCYTKKAQKNRHEIHSAKPLEQTKAIHKWLTYPEYQTVQSSGDVCSEHQAENSYEILQKGPITVRICNVSDQTSPTPEVGLV